MIHTLLSYIQHVAHLRPGEVQGLQISQFDGDFSRDPFPDLGDAAELAIFILRMYVNPEEIPDVFREANI